MRFRLLAGCLAIFLAACGTPGAPLPPSLRLPRPVEDLKAVRQGDKVLLTWTAPKETTDRGGIRGTATALVCRGYRTETVEGTDAVCANVTGEVPSPSGSGSAFGQKTTFTDEITNLLGNPAQDFISYSIEVRNAEGRSAGPSNAVTIFLAPSMAAPQNVSARLERDRIVIGFSGAAPPAPTTLRANYFYRVVRTVIAPASSGPTEAVVGETSAQAGAASVSDKDFVWERRYVYRVVGVTQVLSRDGKVLAEFEGQPAGPTEVNAHDVFAPERPQGLQAVYSGVETQRSIDLTWTPNEDDDLEGYNVFRREGTGEAARVNKELVKTPSYRDADVQPGKTYIYTVTAVDKRGNEGKASEPSSEKVPD